jgi:hypothetical protein
MFPWWPKAILPGLCLALMLSPQGARAAASQPAVQDSVRAPAADSQRASALPRPRAEAVDPFLAAMLGAMPLMSGFYLTSSPQKGIVFTLADAMLIGTIIMIRSDKHIPPKDAAVYFCLLGAVNVADLALSVLQARSDAASRLSVYLDPPDRPGFRLAWRF